MLDTFVYGGNTHNSLFCQGNNERREKKNFYEESARNGYKLDFEFSRTNSSCLLSINPSNSTVRARAIEKYKKCFDLALSRSVSDKLDQLHALKVMDYYLKLSKLTPNSTHSYVKVDELPTTASPPRKKKVN